MISRAIDIRGPYLASGAHPNQIRLPAPSRNLSAARTSEEAWGATTLEGLLLETEELPDWRVNAAAIAFGVLVRTP